MLMESRYWILNVHAKGKIPTKTDHPPPNLQCPFLNSPELFLKVTIMSFDRHHAISKPLVYNTSTSKEGRFLYYLSTPCNNGTGS